MFRTEFSQNFVAVLFVAGADDASVGLEALDYVGHYRLRKLLQWDSEDYSVIPPHLYTFERYVNTSLFVANTNSKVSTLTDMKNEPSSYRRHHT